MPFEFDNAFQELLKAEEAAGRPVPDKVRAQILGNRLWWRSAVLIAQDVVVAMHQGSAVTLPMVIDIFDRFPPDADDHDE